MGRALISGLYGASAMDIGKEISRVTGVIWGSDGKGGSGVCVRLKDGQVALLTAKHVLIECLRNTGKVLIGAPCMGVAPQSPKFIKMDSSQEGDAVYLGFHNPTASMHGISYESWTNKSLKVLGGALVYVSGYPGALKQFDDTGIRPKVSCLLGKLFTKITTVSANSFACFVDETRDVPESLEGMSGGGAFSDDGKFLGIVVSEKRRLTATNGEVHVLTPSGFQELYTPFSFPPEIALGGFHSYMQTLTLKMYSGQSKHVASVAVTAEFYWSKTNPSHRFGRVGKLFLLEFLIPGKPRYPINIESIFYWDADTDEARAMAMTEEAKYLLLRIGWLMKTEPGNTTIQVQPMT